MERSSKRRGVALSCAECRRLKLRCSRVFPCTNCVKKGCAAICPQGSLTTGKGNRSVVFFLLLVLLSTHLSFVLANTEILHEKINDLSSRVRFLEDALADAHACYSDQPHPLLSDELLQIKRPLERESTHSPIPKDDHQDHSDAIDAMGSLYAITTDLFSAAPPTDLPK